ncbi:peptidylprolyl isomerase [Halovulum dunhuangense]|uniref:Peptidyl-prolyl cis-trans isomerase n=1 Tax=Halovulum dunhuangense TaxID=1505036 RepID=A0A849L340_9RHOB|nr:peptidylprolyl isomerase [Halovulum dunhuangense]NNU80756.1 peptidylprolyl isomerase [Halovulum dunhuangense]
MIRRSFIGLAAALALGGAALAQEGVDLGTQTLVIDVEGPGANGTIEIELLADVAPAHVERIRLLAEAGAYDGVAFHRVIDGFMAQTGDVEFGTRDQYALGGAGRGGSDLPDLPAEFSDIPFDRGVVGMARAQNPDSANSQFFIMFDEGHFLNGQYTVFGRVASGMEVVDQITRGVDQSGSVPEPDYMTSVRVERR